MDEKQPHHETDKNVPKETPLTPLTDDQLDSVSGGLIPPSPPSGPVPTPYPNTARRER